MRERTKEKWRGGAAKTVAPEGRRRGRMSGAHVADARMRFAFVTRSKARGL